MVYFCVFDVFSLVCFELSVPVQVIASSPKLSITCRAGRKTLLTHSLTHCFQKYQCINSYGCDAADCGTESKLGSVGRHFSSICLNRCIIIRCQMDGDPRV